VVGSGCRCVVVVASSSTSTSTSTHRRGVSGEALKNSPAPPGMPFGVHLGRFGFGSMAVLGALALGTFFAARVPAGGHILDIRKLTPRIPYIVCRGVVVCRISILYRISYVVYSYIRVSYI
jgi:hypothetical protein